jgi:hypothetical protein
MDLSLKSGVQVEEERDVLGGMTVLESGIYKGTVELAYMDESKNGALCVVIHFKTEKGVLIKETTYISNRNKEFTYNRDGKDHTLPGYNIMNSFFDAIAGCDLGTAGRGTEKKVINVWDYDAKKELPVNREVFTDILGKELAIGIIKVSEEKTTPESNYKEGTGEFREKNEFSKFFDADNGLTVTEKKAGETEPAFFHEWKKGKEDYVKVKKAKVSAKTGGTSGMPTAAAAAPVKKLFA